MTKKIVTTKPQPKATASDIPVWCSHDSLADVVSLVPNPRNPNAHPDRQIALLAKIIRAQGWRTAITVSKQSGFITKGHGRLLAAQMLNVEFVPVDFQDYETPASEWADVIADNRIAELAEPNTAMLKDILLEIDTGDFDMDLTGFVASEIEAMMTATAPPPEFDKLGEDDIKTDHQCPKCGYVWSGNAGNVAPAVADETSEGE